MTFKQWRSWSILYEGAEDFGWVANGNSREGVKHEMTKQMYFKQFYY